MLLLTICFIGDHPYWCVAIITLSLGFNGASSLTNLQNGQDLAPNFAGSIYSLINFVGTTSGFLSPMVVAYFTRNGVSLTLNVTHFGQLIYFYISFPQNTIDHWSNVFLVGSIVYIVPAIVFMFFGSGEVQPWNDPEQMKRQKGRDNVEAKLPVSSPPQPSPTQEKTSITRL